MLLFVCPQILEDKGDQSSGSTFTAEKSQGSSCPPSPSEVIIRAHGSNNEGSDVEGGELEDVVDDGEKSSSSSSVRDDDIMLEPSSPVGGEYKTIEWNADSVSDYEGEFAVLPKRPKVGRGTGKRGRPPSRVRLPARESDGKDYGINGEHKKGLLKIAGNWGLWKEESLLFPMNMLICGLTPR